jgi:membrane protein required for colicin V production
MTGLDWLIVAVFLFSVAGAISQGFVHELVSLAGVVVGYLMAAWNYHRLAPWFMQFVKAQWVADYAAFLAIFIVVAVIFGLIARTAQWVMKEVGLRWFDRILGAAFGMLKGALVATVLVVALASFNASSAMLNGSRFAPYLLVVGRAASWLAPSDLRYRFAKGLEVMRTIPNPSGPDQNVKQH